MQLVMIDLINQKKTQNLTKSLSQRSDIDSLEEGGA